MSIKTRLFFLVLFKIKLECLYNKYNFFAIAQMAKLSYKNPINTSLKSMIELTPGKTQSMFTYNQLSSG